MMMQFDQDHCPTIALHLARHETLRFICMPSQDFGTIRTLLAVAPRSPSTQLSMGTSRETD